MNLKVGTRIFVSTIHCTVLLGREKINVKKVKIASVAKLHHVKGIEIVNFSWVSIFLVLCYGSVVTYYG